MLKLRAKIAAAVLMATAAAGSATLLPATGVAMEQPWAQIIYMSGGVPVGTADIYCSGDVVYSGQTTNYDYETWNYYYMCP